MGEADNKKAPAAGDEAIRRVETALSGLDLGGLADSVNRTVQDVARQFGIGRKDTSPYIIYEKGSSGRAVSKAVVGVVLVIVALGCAGVALVSSILAFLSPVFVLGPAVCAVLAAGAGIASFRSGKREKELGDAVRAMDERLGLRESISLSELAQLVDVPTGKLDALLAKAIERGLIPEGHLRGSAGKRVLYLTDRAWEDALDEESKASASGGVGRTQAAQPPGHDSFDNAQAQELPEDAAEVVEACVSFSFQALRARADISDAGVRSSIDGIVSKLESVVSYLRKYPETASQLRKLATYYLPTTEKLVVSYAELEGHGGEKAQSMRSELGETIALVDSALAKFSDDLLQEQSWDLKSDMDVMRTMIEQDGLSA